MIKSSTEKRKCRTPGCPVIFRPARGLLNFRYCSGCTFARRKVKRAFRKRRRQIYGDYPKQGFQQVRKKLSLETEKKCGMCGITSKAHIKEHGIDLHLDHTIPARFVILLGKNPHDECNLMWLCKKDHGRKRFAEERLKGKESVYGFVLQLKIENWDMPLVKSLLEHYGVATERLPF